MSSVSATGTPSVPSPSPSGLPPNPGAELARYESQLSDWVHCPSCTTSYGKAKIAELNDKIQTLKRQVERSEAARQTTTGAKPRLAAAADALPKPGPAADGAGQRVRFDRLGTWLNLQA